MTTNVRSHVEDGKPPILGMAALISFGVFLSLYNGWFPVNVLDFLDVFRGVFTSR